MVHWHSLVPYLFLADTNNVLFAMNDSVSLVDRVNEELQRLMEEMDEEEILRRTSGGRLRIGLTDSGYFPLFRGKQQEEAYLFVDEFETLQEIVAACVLSSYVPGMTGPAPLERSIQTHPAVVQAGNHLKRMVERGVVRDGKGNPRNRLLKDTSELWDGGLVNLFPTINKDSILVTPFQGTFKNPTISPTMVAGSPSLADAPSNGFAISKIPKMALAINRWSSLDLSMENLRTLRYVALSSTDDELQTWFSQGYDTCQQFLSNQNMQSQVSVTVPSNFASSTLKSTGGDKRSLHTLSEGHHPNDTFFIKNDLRKSRRSRLSDPVGPQPSKQKASKTSNPFRSLGYVVAAVTAFLWWIPCMAIDEAHIVNRQINETQNIRDLGISIDSFGDSFLYPLSPDPSCLEEAEEGCDSPPHSTVVEKELEITVTKLDATCFKGGDDVPEEEEDNENSFELAVELHPDQCVPKERFETETIRVDKHWGKDPDVLRMRDLLLNRSLDSLNDSRPPIFLLPGLASTRLGE